MENEYLKKSKTRAIIGVVGCAAAAVLLYIIGFTVNYIRVMLPIVPILMGVYFVIKIQNYKGKNIATNIIQDALIIIMAAYTIENVMLLVDIISNFKISIYVLLVLVYAAYYAVFTIYLYGIFNKQEIISKKIYLIVSIVYAVSMILGSVYNIIAIIYIITLIPYFYKYDYKYEKYGYNNEVKPVEIKKDNISKGERNFTTLSEVKANQNKSGALNYEKKKMLIMAGLALLIALVF